MLTEVNDEWTILVLQKSSLIVMKATDANEFIAHAVWYCADSLCGIPSKATPYSWNGILNNSVCVTVNSFQLQCGRYVCLIWTWMATHKKKNYNDLIKMIGILMANRCSIKKIIRILYNFYRVATDMLNATWSQFQQHNIRLPHSFGKSYDVWIVFFPLQHTNQHTTCDL